MLEIFNLEKVFDTFNYIFYFLILNLFFVLFNIPVLSFFAFVGISKITTYLPIFLILCIPVAPTFTVLLYCMRKLIKNKSLNLLQDIKRGVTLNFLQSTLVWTVELFLVFVLYSNIKFFSVGNKNIFFTVISLILALILLIVSPYIYILISRFSMKTLPLIRSAVVLTFTRPVLTVSNILIFLFSLVIFEIEPALVALFMASIISFLLIFLNKKLIEDLEAKSKNTL